MHEMRPSDNVRHGWLWQWYSAAWREDELKQRWWLGFAMTDFVYRRQLFVVMPFNVLVAGAVWLWERLLWRWGRRIDRARLVHTVWKRGFERGARHGMLRERRRLAVDTFNWVANKMGKGMDG